MSICYPGSQISKQTPASENVSTVVLTQASVFCERADNVGGLSVFSFLE